MSEDKLFIKGTREAVRFSSSRGELTIEDLWKLPLVGRTANQLDLDKIGKEVKRQLKESEEDSMVVRKTTKNALILLRFDIVKYIIDVKLEEQEARKKAAQRREERERLESVIARRKEEQLDSLSIEEAQERLAKLKEES